MFKYLSRANKELRESPALDSLGDAFWSVVYGLFFISSVASGSVGWAIATGIICAVNVAFFIESIIRYKKKYLVK